MSGSTPRLLVTLRDALVSRLPPNAEIPIARCVHYGAFPFGGNAYNPYESYIRALVSGTPREEAREELIDFLRHYRPRHMAEALGGIGLAVRHPLWSFPWWPSPRLGVAPAWHDDPNASPDILTHFSDAGILAFRIEEEFCWLERALYAISTEGYRPDNFGAVLAAPLEAEDGRIVYLLRDGNHRVAALSALGHATVAVRLVRHPVREREVDAWPGVAAGPYSRQDALGVFFAYFDGNRCFRTTDRAAPILHAPDFGPTR